MTAACPSCLIAETNPGTPHQHANCTGCATRALAQSPVFHAAGVEGSINAPYRKALSLVFGDSWRAGHDQVKAAHARIKAARGAA